MYIYIYIYTMDQGSTPGRSSGELIKRQSQLSKCTNRPESPRGGGSVMRSLVVQNLRWWLGPVEGFLHFFLASKLLEMCFCGNFKAFRG